MTRTAYIDRARARSESRDARLQTLGFRDYKDYLNSPSWAKVKAHFRKLVIESCGLCGSEDSLHLHHMTYERVGEELPTDLVWLCRKCHHLVHTLEKRGEMTLDFDGLADFERAARYAAEQAHRKAQSEQHVQAAKYAPERVKRRATTINAQIKQRVHESNPADAQRLLDDLYGVLNSFPNPHKEAA